MHAAPGDTGAARHAAASGDPARRHAVRRPPLRRTSKGRNPIAKRWIYWRRRYSNPTRRDWLLLICLLWILASAALSLVDFRLGGIALAACPLALAGLRAMPSPWGEIWINRSRGVDMATMVLVSVLLLSLTVTVPNV